MVEAAPASLFCFGDRLHFSWNLAVDRGIDLFFLAVVLFQKLEERAEKVIRVEVFLLRFRELARVKEAAWFELCWGCSEGLGAD